MSEIKDAQKLILESDNFVLSEFGKIQYAYRSEERRVGQGGIASALKASQKQK